MRQGTSRMHRGEPRGGTDARPARAPALGAVGPVPITLAILIGVAAGTWLLAGADPAGTPHPDSAAARLLWACAGGWLACVGVLLAVTDVRTHRLPDRLLRAVALLSGPLLVLAALLDGGADHLLRAGAGALLPAGVLYVLALLSPGAVGLGDVKLLLVLGAWLGYLSLPAAVAGPVLGVVLGGLLAVLAVVSRRATLRAHIPLGPALLAGAALATWLQLAGGLV